MSTAARPNDDSADAVIVGAGAAGLATAIFLARAAPETRVVALEGARTLGAKILISGGGRCNITNARVSAASYWGGSRKTIARILAALPDADTRAFFAGIGVALHEEEYGKLFPDSNSARTVLAALVREAQGRGVDIRCAARVSNVRAHADGGFEISYGDGERVRSPVVVLATGGLSFPKTGSDGAGYGFAAGLGHSIVPTTPALAPLLLDGDFAPRLAGVSHEAELRIFIDRRLEERLTGPLLWTHFGVSGPLAMDAARVWHRAALEGRAARVCLRFVPGLEFDAADARLAPTGGGDPRRLVRTLLSQWLPTRVAEALLAHVGAAADATLAHLSRAHRRALAHALTDFELPVRGSRGYGHAEATAGGVPLTEVDARTMESRICRGLFLVGEILDVDGRIGGYNFQWAWSSARVAGEGVARRLAQADGE